MVFFKEERFQYRVKEIHKAMDETIKLFKEQQCAKQKVRELEFELMLEKQKTSLDDSDNSQKITDLETETKMHNEELEQSVHEIQDLEKRLEQIKQ